MRVQLDRWVICIRLNANLNKKAATRRKQTTDGRFSDRDRNE
jgi:hypothetical protein